MAAKKKQTIDFSAEKPLRVSDTLFYGIPLNDEQKVFADAIWNPDIDIIFCNSRAGTGKTTVATGVANMLVGYGSFDGIVYVMSPYGERKQGWLPGSIEEKSAVYFDAFYQALLSIDINPHSVVSTENIMNQKNGTGYIACITDTFLRGTNLDNCVVIIDEAQNYTVPQLKKVLTRVGKKSKVIVIGHELQCDLDDKALSGFTKYLNHFKDHDRVAVCTLVQNHRGWISQFADELNE